MGYKCLSNVYCHTHCVFYDKCRANIGDCVIFKFEQMLINMSVEKLDLEIFKFYYGLMDGIYYTREEISNKYNIPPVQVNKALRKIHNRLRLRKEELSPWLKIILSTDNVTPYSLIVKFTFGYEGTNIEALTVHNENIERTIDREKLLLKKLHNVDIILIEDLNLSIRAYNLLKSVGITKFDEIRFKTEFDFHSIRNFSKKMIEEIIFEIERVNKLIDDANKDLTK